MDRDFRIEDGILKEYKGTSKEVIIPDGVTVVGENVFLGKRITSVTIPDSVVEVKDKAFHECEELKSVHLSNNLEKIGYCAFCGISLDKIVIPSSVKTIRWGAFCDYWTANLTEVIFPKNSKLQVVESRAFGMHPMLKEIRIPARLKEAFAEDAFDQTCKIIWI